MLCLPGKWTVGNANPLSFVVDISPNSLAQLV